MIVCGRSITSRRWRSRQITDSDYQTNAQAITLSQVEDQSLRFIAGDAFPKLA
jgi:hypothetical protein